MKRIAILISGRGSNMVALSDSIRRGAIPNAEVALVVSDKADARGIDAARSENSKLSLSSGEVVSAKNTKTKLSWRSVSTISIWFAWLVTCDCYRRISLLRLPDGS